MASGSNKEDELPSDYDTIVLGTGLAETILASAFSRSGLKVLHLDRNSYYGSQWATHTFTSLTQWIQDQKNGLNIPEVDVEKAESLLNEGERLRAVKQNVSSFHNVQEEWFIEEGDEVPAVLPKPSEPQPVNESAEPQPANESPEPQPANESAEPQPANESPEPQPVNESPEPQPANESPEPQPVNKSAEPQPANESPEPQPVNKSPEHDSETDPAPCQTETEIEESSITGTETEIEESSITETETEESSITGTETETEESSITGETDSNSVPTPEETINEPPRTVLTRRDVRKQYRKFNLDLRPKILYSRGALVNLLISSDIAKYCEFKLVTRILTRRDGKLEPVPCSRSDVFASQAINMIEKRMLMKFLEFALNYQDKTEELTEFRDKPFVDYLKSRKLTPIVIHYILNAIAMTEGEQNTLEGLTATHRYLMSLGRYGNSSFLWPLYGVSEIPQAFSRMCAVFGGVYCLNKSPSHLIVDNENKCVGVVCDGRRLNCNWAVMETSYATDEILPPESERFVSRAILLTDRALAPDKEEEITIMYMPKSVTGTCSVHVLELPPSSYAAPKGIYVVHLTCESLHASPHQDLDPVVDILFSKTDQDDTKPRILWSLYFNQSETSTRSLLRPLVDHVEILSGPDSSIHIGLPVEQAKAKFIKICPDEEFLPKAPHPDDIIIEGAEETNDEGIADTATNETSADAGNQVEPSETTTGAEAADDAELVLPQKYDDDSNQTTDIPTGSQ